MRRKGSAPIQGANAELGHVAGLPAKGSSPKLGR